MGIDSLGNRTTPQRRSRLFSAPAVYKGAPADLVVTSGTTPLTLTAAQLLTGFIQIDTQDAATLTLPTATLILAAVPGMAVDDVLDFTIVNDGDSTLTVAVGTGITNKVLAASVDAVLTIATCASRTFKLVCTAVANPSGQSQSDTFDLYGISQSAAVLS